MCMKPFKPSRRLIRMDGNEIVQAWIAAGYDVVIECNTFRERHEWFSCELVDSEGNPTPLAGSYVCGYGETALDAVIEVYAMITPPEK